MSEHQQQPIDQRIEAAALELLRELGADFTIEDLARKAGLSRASLYRRIGSKAALLERLARATGNDHDQPDTRRKILQAARQVFSQSGLLAATMEQIAQAAGVGVATVYRQFGDKDQLVRTFIGELSPQAAVHGIAVHPSADVRADLRRITAAVVPFLHEQRDLLRLVIGGSEADRAYLQTLRAGTERTRDLLIGYFSAQQQAGRLRAGVEPHELAMVYIGMILGFVVGPAQLGVALATPERISAIVVDVLLDGLLAAPAGGSTHEG